MNASCPAKILFVTYGAGHARIAAKVAQEMATDARFSCEILALTTASQVMDESGLEYRQCCDFLPMSGYEQAEEYGGALAQGLWNESSPVSHRETCAYLGTSMVDLVGEVGESQAHELYAHKGRKAFKPVGFLTRLLSQIRPDAVVTTCHVRMERAANIAARELGIPSLLIEDLFGYTMMGESPMQTRQIVLPHDEWPAKVAVWNDFVRRRMVQAGLPEEMVVVTGQPVLSDWPPSGAEDQTGICEELGRDPRPVVTYMSTATRQFVYEQVPVLLDLATRRSDLQFAFKLHPSFSLQEFEALGHTLPENVRLLWREDIAQLIRHSDVVIQRQSTTGLQAILSGCPLIVFNTSYFEEQLPFVGAGAALGVYDPAALEPAIDQLLRDGPCNSNSDAFENPAHASSRVLDLLEEMATGSATRRRAG